MKKKVLKKFVHEESKDCVTPAHIDLLMEQCHCTRLEAVKALRTSKDDVVEAVLILQ